MKKALKKRLQCVLPLLLSAAWLGACGSSNDYIEGSRDYAENGAVATQSAAYYATDDIYMDEEYMEEAALADSPYDDAGNGEVSQQAESAQNSNRKLIRNISMDVETREFESLIGTVKNRTKALGGYVESSYEYNGSSYYSGQSRSANLTLRIPAEQADAFIAEVAGLSNITRQSEDVTDVTLSYVDMESHRNVLRAEEERLTELLAETETIEEMIYIESRLSDIRYQIESMESQLRTYDNKVDYTTIYITITEVEELTPIEPEQEPTTWERLSSGFVDSLMNVGRGIRDFFVGLVIILPYLLVCAVVVFIFILIIRGIVRSARKKAQKRQEERQAAWAAWQAQQNRQNPQGRQADATEAVQGAAPKEAGIKEEVSEPKKEEEQTEEKV